MSFDFPFVRLFGVRKFVITLIFKYSFVCSTSLDVTTGNWEIVRSHMFNLMGMLFSSC